MPTKTKKLTKKTAPAKKTTAKKMAAKTKPNGKPRRATSGGLSSSGTRSNKLKKPAKPKAPAPAPVIDELTEEQHAALEAPAADDQLFGEAHEGSNGHGGGDGHDASNVIDYNDEESE